MIYKFDWLNGGAEITDPIVSWSFAGFDTKGAGRLTVGIDLVTDSAKFYVELSTEGQATDRSDEAINALMNQLLQPYIV